MKHLLQCHIANAFIAGIALFAMFFGSGNLIFPISIGINTLSLYSIAAIGLILTGVLIPMLGLFSVINSTHDNILDFFKELGRPIAWLLSFSIVILLGPLGVIPRSLMVATGGLELIFPKISLPLMDALTILLTGIIVYKQHNIIELIGKILTPFLLVSILCIIIFGLSDAPSMQISEFKTINAFSFGFFQGYQTMDLLAAIFFSLFISKYLEVKIGTTKNDHNFLMLTLYTCIICGLLLAIVYFSFLYLGAHYANLLQNVPPQQFLEKLTVAALGNYALPIVSITIFLACLTTLCSVLKLNVDFFHKHCKLENFSYNSILLAVMIISYIISFLKFDVLARYLAQTLNLIYPGLIIYALLKLLQRKLHIHKYFIVTIFWLIVLISVLF